MKKGKNKNIWLWLGLLGATGLAVYYYRKDESNSANSGRTGSSSGRSGRSGEIPQNTSSNTNFANQSAAEKKSNNTDVDMLAYLFYQPVDKNNKLAEDVQNQILTILMRYVTSSDLNELSTTFKDVTKTNLLDCLNLLSAVNLTNLTKYWNNLGIKVTI